MLYGADTGWWTYHWQEALKFQGLKVTCSNCVESTDVLRLVSTGTDGFDPKPGAIRTGRNSAYQVVHIAAQAGAARILLCGVDMHARGGSHHHGDHPEPLRNTSHTSFQTMLKSWRTLVEPLQTLGIEVINCSPGSDLDCFPKMSIEDALC